jgi:hypothetical protein
MNDQELMTAVKQSVSGAHMHVPAEQIVSRSRAIRARRRTSVAAGALAVAAGAALAVTALVPSGRASHQPTAQLAAWTVTKQANGDIHVTLRQLRDPAGLQRTLRADGVPATVTFKDQRNPACHSYPAGTSQSQNRRMLSSAAAPAGHNSMVIHPSALPSDAGLQIYTLFQNYPGPHGSFQIAVGLVQASPQCTGG